MDELGDSAAVHLEDVSVVHIYFLETPAVRKRVGLQDSAWDFLELFHRVWVSPEVQYDFETELETDVETVYGGMPWDSDSRAYIRYPPSHSLSEAYMASPATVLSGNHRLFRLHSLFSSCLVTTRYWSPI